MHHRTGPVITAWLAVELRTAGQADHAWGDALIHHHVGRLFSRSEADSEADAEQQNHYCFGGHNGFLGRGVGYGAVPASGVLSDTAISAWCWRCLVLATLSVGRCHVAAKLCRHQRGASVGCGGRGDSLWACGEPCR